MDALPLYKQCPRCSEERPLTAFHRDASRPDGRFSWCAKCTKAYRRDEYVARREPIKARMGEASRRNRLRERAAALKAYGGLCRCCGEARQEFLTIDHIDGGGNRHREITGGASNKTYRWLRKNDYPEGFQVLCHNCNAAKHIYGVCPHKTETLMEAI